MTIDALIDKTDASELIRDQIAAILVTEVASQQALALLEAPPRDPDKWELRVFVERSNPLDEFNDTPDSASPIVCVSLENISYEMRNGNVVERQKATATYNIDVYGYGVSTGTVAGHDPSDRTAALECQRAVRLVRNILMSATYTYLGTPRKASQYVWRRWIQSIQFMQPQENDRAIQGVYAARIAFQVEFNETSPQVTGSPIEAIVATVKRTETGQVLLVAQYGEESAPPDEEEP
jgi:hypothetical protein